MALASYTFLIGFLPVVLLLDAWVARRSQARHGRALLLLASLVFCAYAGALTLAWVVASSVLTFAIVRALQAREPDARARPWLLGGGIALHVVGLGFFKYAGFGVDTWNALTGSAFAFAAPAFPLGISFITFQQIAYLIEAAHGETREDGALDYALFVGFFPKLVAGPLADPRKLTPQLREGRVRSDADLALGLTLLAAGLFKKVMIADELGEVADPVFGAAAAGSSLDALTAWTGALAYTLQLYFDFSGYSDMALGAARCLGIRLPLNFDSPYQASNIGDFWRRWHMTLTRFLTQYLYTPMATPLTRLAVTRSLGPTRLFALTVAIPSIVTFAIAGLWHGAGFTFVVFGLLHGIYLTLHQGWRELRRAWLGRPAPSRARTLGAWSLTFTGVVVAFVFFRAGSLGEAFEVLQAMCGLAPPALEADPLRIEGRDFLLVGGVAAIAWLFPNVAQILREHAPALDSPRPSSWLGSRWTWQPSPSYALLSVALWIVSLAALGEVSAFIYYQF